MMKDDVSGECGWCGCCGRAYDDTEGEWCGNCAGHVSDDGMPWDRTFLSLTGDPCPYQVGAYR